jgi:uncharacterized membrane protein YccC
VSDAGRGPSHVSWLEPVRRDLVGVRFAVNVWIASAIVWYTLRHIADTNPIWAIASMIASSEPEVKEAARMFRSRLVNVLVGGAVGLAFLLVGGADEWKLPLALAVSVLVSSYVIHIQTMWRQAPITAAIVIAAGVTHQSKLTGVEHGLHKVAEVVFGCLVGLSVSYVMSKAWPMVVAHRKE